MKERMAAQSDQIAALDTKANTILGIATTIIATALILQAVLLAAPAAHLSGAAYSFSQEGLLVLLLLYLVTMLTAAFSGYWVRAYKRVPEPSQLLTYIAKPLQETKETLVGTMAQAFEQNERIIKKKVWGTRIAMIVFGIEVVALVALLALQLFS
jgi:hypothetical protein